MSEPSAPGTAPALKRSQRQSVVSLPTDIPLGISAGSGLSNSGGNNAGSASTRTAAPPPPRDDDVPFSDDLVREIQKDVGIVGEAFNVKTMAGIPPRYLTLNRKSNKKLKAQDDQDKMDQQMAAREGSLVPFSSADGSDAAATEADEAVRERRRSTRSTRTRSSRRYSYLSVQTNLPLPILRKFDREQSEVRYKRRARPSVLIVDDNLMHLAACKVIFDKYFESVHVATNGKQALELMEHVVFDAVFLDAEMPVFSGPETAEVIRHTEESIGGRAFRTLIVGMFTRPQSHDDGIMDDMFLSGVDRYVLKPLVHHARSVVDALSTGQGTQEGFRRLALQKRWVARKNDIEAVLKGQPGRLSDADRELFAPSRADRDENLTAGLLDTVEDKEAARKLTARQRAEDLSRMQLNAAHMRETISELEYKVEVLEEQNMQMTETRNEETILNLESKVRELQRLLEQSRATERHQKRTITNLEVDVKNLITNGSANEKLVEAAERRSDLAHIKLQQTELRMMELEDYKARYDWHNYYGARDYNVSRSSVTNAVTNAHRYRTLQSFATDPGASWFRDQLNSMMESVRTATNSMTGKMITATDFLVKRSLLPSASMEQVKRDISEVHQTVMSDIHDLCEALSSQTEKNVASFLTRELRFWEKLRQDDLESLQGEIKTLIGDMEQRRYQRASTECQTDAFDNAVLDLPESSMISGEDTPIVREAAPTDRNGEPELIDIGGDNTFLTTEETNREVSPVPVRATSSRNLSITADSLPMTPRTAALRSKSRSKTPRDRVTYQSAAAHSQTLSDLLKFWEIIDADMYIPRKDKVKKFEAVFASAELGDYTMREQLANCTANLHSIMVAEAEKLHHEYGVRAKLDLHPPLVMSSVVTTDAVVESLLNIAENLQPLLDISMTAMAEREGPTGTLGGKYRRRSISPRRGSHLGTRSKDSSRRSSVNTSASATPRGTNLTGPAFGESSMNSGEKLGESSRRKSTSRKSISEKAGAAKRRASSVVQATARLARRGTTKPANDTPTSRRASVAGSNLTSGRSSKRASVVIQRSGSNSSSTRTSEKVSPATTAVPSPPSASLGAPHAPGGLDSMLSKELSKAISKMRKGALVDKKAPTSDVVKRLACAALLESAMTQISTSAGNDMLPPALSHTQVFERPVMVIPMDSAVLKDHNLSELATTFNTTVDVLYALNGSRRNVASEGADLSDAPTKAEEDGDEDPHLPLSEHHHLVSFMKQRHLSALRVHAGLSQDAEINPDLFDEETVPLPTIRIPVASAVADEVFADPPEDAHINNKLDVSRSPGFQSARTPTGTPRTPEVAPAETWLVHPALEPTLEQIRENIRGIDAASASAAAIGATIEASAAASVLAVQPPTAVNSRAQFTESTRSSVAGPPVAAQPPPEETPSSGSGGIPGHVELPEALRVAHNVAGGETINGIAALYRVTPETIVKANPQLQDIPFDRPLGNIVHVMGPPPMTSDKIISAAAMPNAEKVAVLSAATSPMRTPPDTTKAAAVDVRDQDSQAGGGAEEQFDLNTFARKMSMVTTMIGSEAAVVEAAECGVQTDPVSFVAPEQPAAAPIPVAAPPAQMRDNGGPRQVQIPINLANMASEGSRITSPDGKPQQHPAQDVTSPVMPQWSASTTAAVEAAKKNLSPPMTPEDALQRYSKDRTPSGTVVMTEAALKAQMKTPEQIREEQISALRQKAAKCCVTEALKQKKSVAAVSHLVRPNELEIYSVHDYADAYCVSVASLMTAHGPQARQPMFDVTGHFQKAFIDRQKVKRNATNRPIGTLRLHVKATDVLRRLDEEREMLHAKMGELLVAATHAALHGDREVREQIDGDIQALRVQLAELKIASATLSTIISATTVEPKYIAPVAQQTMSSTGGMLGLTSRGLTALSSVSNVSSLNNTASGLSLDAAYAGFAVATTAAAPGPQLAIGPAIPNRGSPSHRVSPTRQVPTLTMGSAVSAVPHLDLKGASPEGLSVQAAGSTGSRAKGAEHGRPVPPKEPRGARTERGPSTMAVSNTPTEGGSLTARSVGAAARNAHIGGQEPSSLPTGRFGTPARGDEPTSLSLNASSVGGKSLGSGAAPAGNRGAEGVRGGAKPHSSEEAREKALQALMDNTNERGRRSSELALGTPLMVEASVPKEKSNKWTTKEPRGPPPAAKASSVPKLPEIGRGDPSRVPGGSSTHPSSTTAGVGANDDVLQGPMAPHPPGMDRTSPVQYQQAPGSSSTSTRPQQPQQAVDWKKRLKQQGAKAKAEADAKQAALRKKFVESYMS